VADEGDAVKVEFFNDRREIVGKYVEIVAAARITGAPMAAPVIGDAAQALCGEIHHLVLPKIGVNRPAVDENHWLASAPVAIKQPDSVSRLDERYRKRLRLGLLALAIGSPYGVGIARK
jgi:hypothetical protein